MKNRAFVKYKKTGEIVPGSLLITQGGYPKGGPYKEITMDLCCDTSNCPTEDYDGWKLVTGGIAGDGRVINEKLDETNRYTIIGPNDGADEGWVYLTQYFPEGAVFDIDYEWTSFDDSNPTNPPQYDWPIYWSSTTEPTGEPDDITKRVSGTPESDTWNITVNPGEWFSVGIYTTDNCCGRGFLQIDFDFTP